MRNIIFTILLAISVAWLVASLFTDETEKTEGCITRSSIFIAAALVVLCTP